MGPAPPSHSLIARELAGRALCAVTHSLGGIVVRHMHDPRLAWQRIVMLAPPNQGSQVAGAFGGNPLYKWFYGPAGQELADPRTWPAPPAPFAVIAGTHGDALSNPPSWVVRRARVFATGVVHDGTVAVDETRLDGMAAFATVPATHTWIMNHPQSPAPHENRDGNDALRGWNMDAAGCALVCSTATSGRTRLASGSACSVAASFMAFS